MTSNEFHAVTLQIFLQPTTCTKTCTYYQFYMFSAQCYNRFVHKRLIKVISLQAYCRIHKYKVHKKCQEETKNEKEEEKDIRREKSFREIFAIKDSKRRNNNHLPFFPQCLFCLPYII